jgi:HAE1 family hydrophobic/amphiphilic exporter-1
VFLARTAVKKPVMTTMLVMAFVVLGFFSWRRLVIDLLPDVEFPFVIVTTAYPGAGPNEVETQITKKIEDAVSTISNLKSLESISQENVSIVMIEFELGVDVDVSANEVKDKVDAILADFPDDAKPPVIQKFDINAEPIIDLAVSSPRPLEEVYRITKNDIKDYISRVEGVASVAIIGGREREIQVAVDKRLMKAYGLSLPMIAGAIAAENLNVPAGRITEKRKEYTLRVLGEFTDLDQLRKIRIPLNDHSSIALENVAEVIDGFKDQRNLARFNGKSSVGVEIQKRSGANTVKTSEGIYKVLEELKDVLPPDFDVAVAKDRSQFIKDAVKDVTQNIFIGIILTTILLYLFLHSLRVTTIAAIAMPTSVVATFLLIDFAGFTLNIMTLMALGITVGVLVTNAIVVLENIIRHLEMGKPSDEAAVDGTSEIALAVVASTLTNIVVFTPIAFMSGIVGRFFYQFGLTVVFATLFSLLVSFTLTPLLASKFFRDYKPRAKDAEAGGEALRAGRGEGVRRKFERAWDSFYDSLTGLYKKSLESALAHRARVIGMVLVVFFFALFLLGRVGGEFMPTLDEGFITVEIEMPPGSSIGETDGVLREVEDKLSRLPETVSVLASIGGPNKGVEDATIVLKIVPKSEREMGIVEFANSLKPMLATIPDAKIRVKATSGGAGEDESDIMIDVTGPDIDVLKTLSQVVYDSVATVQGLSGLKTSYQAEKPEIDFVPDRKELDRFGLSSLALAMALRAGYEGDVTSRYREANDEYDIRVRYAEDERDEVGDLAATEIQAGDYVVPLTQLGRIEFGTTQREILRRNREKLIRIEANVGSGTLNELVGEIRSKVAGIDFPPGYRIHYGGMVEMQEESFASIFTALILAIILTYMVLAGVLESFLHPITVMMTLPLGLVGMSFALFITGQTINIFSLMALVMLVGIVVNNAILLLDYTSVLRSRGMAKRQALLEACPVRLRPIIISNLAIAIGMLPQALGGAGSEFRAVMAIVTMGGVLVSAVFTLYVVPVIYDLLDRGK